MSEETKMILEAIQELQADMKEVKAYVQELKIETQEVRKDIKKLQDRQEMFEHKLDKLQDSHERMDADIRTMSGELASGFYKTKHQIRALDDQMETVIKVLELKDILPLTKSYH